MSKGDLPRYLVGLFLPALSDLFCRPCAAERVGKVTAFNVLLASFYQLQEAFACKSCAIWRQAKLSIPNVMLASLYQPQEAFAL